MTERSELIVEEIPSALAGERVDRVVALVADVSRRQAADLVSTGRVLVDGEPPVKASDRVAEGSVISVETIREDDQLQIDPSVVFTVVYEDAHVLIVDKPPHLVVHPGSGVSTGTLVNGLLASHPQIAEVGEAGRPGVVHRLDKGTSGLLAVALSSEAHRSLTEQLAARTVSRHYLALAEGIVESDSGVVDAPLGRSPRNALRRAVVADGRPARTHYTVLRRWQEHDRTLLECRLETGRTHQIRAHLTAIGHPVAGDLNYGASSAAHGLNRPFLHAASLGFEHPSTGDWVEHTSELPADLQAVVELLDQA